MQFKSYILATVASLAAGGALALAAPAWAHHSHANYDSSEYLLMDGTVTEVHWMNPHVWLYFETADEAGEQSVWALEGGSVGALTRGGWRRDSMATGDTISVRCYPLRDGSKGCLLGYITIPGQEEKEFD